MSGQGFGEGSCRQGNPAGLSVPPRTSPTQALTLSQSIPGVIGGDFEVLSTERPKKILMGISTPKPSSGFGSGSYFTAKNLDQFGVTPIAISNPIAFSCPESHPGL